MFVCLVYFNARVQLFVEFYSRTKHYSVDFIGLQRGLVGHLLFRVDLGFEVNYIMLTVSTAFL